jgi:hypothetical protein
MERTDDAESDNAKDTGKEARDELTSILVDMSPLPNDRLVSIDDKEFHN